MRDDLIKNRFYIYLTACLCLAKFVIVPLFDAYNSAQQTNAMLAKKLDKLAGLVSLQDELTAQAQNIESKLDKIKPLLYSAEDVAGFQLTEQKRIEAHLTEFELDKKNIGWKTAYTIDGTNVTKLQVEYRFDGTTLNAMRYLSELSKEKNLLDFEEFGVSFRSQRPGRAGFSTVFLRRNYYMFGGK